MQPFKKASFQKVPLEIKGIGETNDRIIEVTLKDGRSVRLRRDLVEIFGDRAFVPLWLADKIMGK